MTDNIESALGAVKKAGDPDYPLMAQAQFAAVAQAYAIIDIAVSLRALASRE